MTMLELALSYVARGWHVFPCYTASKEPAIAGGKGWVNASGDADKVATWWFDFPDANIAIAGNGSDLAVLDIDHGLADEAAWLTWCIRNNIPRTYAVRTGRRPEFGVQMYFSGRIPDVGIFHLDGCSGQIKSAGGYVMAAGSVHPDSGEKYVVILDVPVVPLPDVIRALRKPEKAKTNSTKVLKTAWQLPVGPGENRTGFLLEQMGTVRNMGFGQVAILGRLMELNEDPEIIAEPVSHQRLEDLAANCAKMDILEPDPVAVLGSSLGVPDAAPVPVADWRTHYHTFEEMDSAPPAEFLIEGFLQLDAISALAAPVGQRKSLIALNVAHALLTQEPLFDHFKVERQPTRVLYLCPEMGIRSFTERLRKIGLMEYVGKSLFCRTMSMDTALALKELTEVELAGALVIIDTAVRYLEGDESSSEDMRQFAASIFRLMRAGAAAVLLLHHSAKGTKDASELSLENAMRGSGELGAFVTSCWATRLQNPSEPYDSASYVVNVKQRDFASNPFEVTSGPDCRLHIVAAPSADIRLNTGTPGTARDADGREGEALQFITDNPGMTIRQYMAGFKERGIVRGKTWVSNKRMEIHKTGASHTSD